MKKFTEFLERNVQWVVLSLGVVYLLYMAWSYLIFPPVKVTGIGPDSLSSAEVDQKIYETVAQPLEGKMREGKPPKIEVPNFVAQFQTDMDKQDAKPLADVYVWLPPSTSPELPPDPKDQQKPPGFAPNNKVPGAGGVVAALPNIAAPKLTGVKNGMSSVIAPPAPDQPPPDQNNPGAMAVAGVDKSWVTVRFEIDPKQLVAEWDAAKIPQGTVNTTFLQVVLERQELQPDGSWGNPAPVPVLALQSQQNPPPPQFPAADAPPQDLWLYLQWANTHQVDIVQPPFYQVAKGDQWSIPGEAAPVNPQQQQAFDPNQYLDAPQNELLKLTMDQRRQVQAARDKRAKENAKGHRNSGPSTPRGPRGPYGPGGPGGGE